MVELIRGARAHLEEYFRLSRVSIHQGARWRREHPGAASALVMLRRFEEVLEEVEPRACVRCGCTEFRACVDPKRGMTCHWVGPNLCSFCETPKQRRMRIATEMIDS